MSKKIRRDPIYIAPNIVGWLDEDYNPHVIDETTFTELDPTNIADKIIIYERQVFEWFLNPATSFTKSNAKNKGFIALMVCLSYLEGVEQYRRGATSVGNSRNFFVSALKRIYPNTFDDYQLRDFYEQARCGLFHAGMVKGRIIINNSFTEPIRFVDDYDIRVNPKKLLEDIKADFRSYIQQLKDNPEVAHRFDQMYSNL